MLKEYCCRKSRPCCSLRVLLQAYCCTLGRYFRFFSLEFTVNLMIGLFDLSARFDDDWQMIQAKRSLVTSTHEFRYAFGDGSASTFVYDVNARSWSTTTNRPYRGDHHKAVVVGTTIYLVGGFTWVAFFPSSLVRGSLMIELNGCDVLAYEVIGRITRSPFPNTTHTHTHTHTHMNRYPCIVSTCVGHMQALDTQTNTWETLGQLPYIVEASVAAEYVNSL